MSQIVLDASTALDWFLPSPEGAAYSLPLMARTLRGEETFLVPEHFIYEVSRVLVLRALRGKSPLGKDWLGAAMRQLDALPIDTLLCGFSFDYLGTLSETYGLSAPDVPYFHMARELGLAIATRDAEIIHTCQVWSVQWWEPPKG